MVLLKGKMSSSEGLEAHIELRRIHGASPLTHSPEYSKMAQKWANIIATRNHAELSKKEYQKKGKLEKVASTVSSYNKSNIINSKASIYRWNDIPFVNHRVYKENNFISRSK